MEKLPEQIGMPCVMESADYELFHNYYRHVRREEDEGVQVHSFFDYFGANLTADLVISKVTRLQKKRGYAVCGPSEVKNALGAVFDSPSVLADTVCVASGRQFSGIADSQEQLTSQKLVDGYIACQKLVLSLQTPVERGISMALARPEEMEKPTVVPEQAVELMFHEFPVAGKSPVNGGPS